MPTGNYAAVNGIDMYYEIQGEGKPLVLIHGGGSTILSNWGNIIPLLVKRHTVIAVELQAHGRTSDRNAPGSFQQDADDVAFLLKKLNIPKANILGFSNDGSTTLQLATNYPGLVDKIIVVSGAYRRDGFIPGFFEGLKQATLNNMPQGLQEAFLKVNPDRALLHNMFEKDKACMLDFKDCNDDDLASVTAQALIIATDKECSAAGTCNKNVAPYSKCCIDDLARHTW